MRQAHATPGRRLLLQHLADASEAAHKLRRGRGWGKTVTVFRAMVGTKLLDHMLSLLLLIFHLEDTVGTADEVELRTTDMAVALGLNRLGLLHFGVHSCRINSAAIGAAFEKTILAIARREIPDNYDPDGDTDHVEPADETAPATQRPRRLLDC